MMNSLEVKNDYYFKSLSFGGFYHTALLCQQIIKHVLACNYLKEI